MVRTPSDTRRGAHPLPGRRREGGPTARGWVSLLRPKKSRQARPSLGAVSAIDATTICWDAGDMMQRLRAIRAFEQRREREEAAARLAAGWTGDLPPCPRALKRGNARRPGGAWSADEPTRSRASPRRSRDRRAPRRTRAVATACCCSAPGWPRARCRSRRGRAPGPSLGARQTDRLLPCGVLDARRDRPASARPWRARSDRLDRRRRIWPRGQELAERGERGDGAAWPSKPRRRLMPRSTSSCPRSLSGSAPVEKQSGRSFRAER